MPKTADTGFVGNKVFLGACYPCNADHNCLPISGDYRLMAVAI